MEALRDFASAAGSTVIAVSVAWFSGIGIIVTIRDIFKLTPWPWLERFFLRDKLKAFVVIFAFGLAVGVGNLVWEQQKEIASLERRLEEARMSASAVKASVQGSKEEARKVLASMNYPLTGKGMLTAASEAPEVMHHFRTLEVDPSEADVVEAVQALSGRKRYNFVGTLSAYISGFPRAKAAILSMRETSAILLSAAGSTEPLNKEKLCAPGIYRYFGKADQDKVSMVCKTSSDRDFSARYGKVVRELIGM